MPVQALVNLSPARWFGVATDWLSPGAGTCEYLDIADYSSDVIEKNIQTNVIGTVRCVEISLPALRRTRSKGLPAALVIVGSSAWWFPFARAEGYGASKAALAYFAQSLRADRQRSCQRP